MLAGYKVDDEQPTLFKIEERVSDYALFVNGKHYPNNYRTREQAERAAEEISRYWIENE
jgi:hypothetical protein